ncbi:hypothetical protein UFOVP820_1, partial [uncultured Caudovirales phage]
MTTHIDEDFYVISAAEDLSVAGAKYKAVTLNGTIAQSAVRAFGILKYGASSGGNASVVYEGLTKGFVGAAVSTLGWPLTVAASGWLVAANSGQQAVGRCLAVVASGDIAPVAVDFKSVG